MIAFPWSLLLTAAFTFTGLACVAHLVKHRQTPGLGAEKWFATMDSLVHLNHLIMSIGMVAMVWIATIGPLATWVQVVFFTVFAVVMILGLVRVRQRVPGVDLVGHIVLNASMVWMLLAMPLLMAHPMSPAGHDQGHGSGAGMAMEMAPVPQWVELVNWVAVAVSTAVAVWWFLRLLRPSSHRAHDLCHSTMGAGMALMLALM